MKNREELACMTVKQLKSYAKDIGCCLGYDASSKQSVLAAIVSYQHYTEHIKRDGERHE